jgi:hypothetical protein
MYAVAGIYLGHADHLPLVALIGRTEFWLAVAAFLATLAAMLWHLWAMLVRPGLPRDDAARTGRQSSGSFALIPGGKG